MATKKEIMEHLKIALEEIGEIKPYFEEEVNAWVFEHPYYPVRYPGNTKEEVIKNYPLWLREFIEERLEGNLAPSVESRTKGKAGIKISSVKKKIIKKKSKVSDHKSIPVDVLVWLNKPENIKKVRSLMAKKR